MKSHNRNRGKSPPACFIWSMIVIWLLLHGLAPAAESATEASVLGDPVAEAEAEQARLVEDLNDLDRRIREMGSRLHQWDMGGGSPRELVRLLERQSEEARLAWEARYRGQNWTSPATGMEFVWIEALKLWVGKFEVTNGEYRKKEAGHDSKAYKGHSLNGDRQPVVCVNFDDAKAYAAWLTERDRVAGRLPAGCRYRLPREEEFTTYAQCGDGREYPWGNEWPPRSGQAGNYHGQEGAGTWGKTSGYNDGHPVTCDVEKSWKNPWGLYGVGGNVWEACASDSFGGSFGAWRGASWITYDRGLLRCARRFDYGGSYGVGILGFRLVLSR
jgi:hypothetical protein